MNIRKILKRQVQRFITENEASLSKQELYSAIAEHFDLDRKTISKYYLELQNKGILEDVNSIVPAKYTNKEVNKILQQTGEDLTVSLTLDYEIKTLEQLLAVCEVDTTKWEVKSWQCGKRDIHNRNAEKQLVLTPTFTVRAYFKQITADNSLVVQKDILLKELLQNSPYPDFSVTHEYKEKPVNTNNLLELALFDVHFGKLAHKEESGEDYDLKIAAKRYKDAVTALLGRVNINSLEKILLPVGNDLINIDNNQGTTTAGTSQDTDSRFYKIVRTVKNLLIETINMLSDIAPVDVIICAGNHDQQTSFMIGEMLEAYYHNNSLVNIDNGAALRKYYSYGKVSIMFTHGDKEKHSSLGMIFAAENPKLWGATKERYVQIGHFHHNKKINYLSTEEFQGFIVQILPSLSGSDFWHNGKGFIPLKQAKAFLFNKTEGLIGEFPYTV